MKVTIVTKTKAYQYDGDKFEIFDSETYYAINVFNDLEPVLTVTIPVGNLISVGVTPEAQSEK